MKRATGFTAVLMAAAMVFTMAGCGSSKDADTSAKKETKTEDSKDKENSGKTYYGQAVEILSGLDGSEYIAFPYGKNVKEGVRVRETDELAY